MVGRHASNWVALGLTIAICVAALVCQIQHQPTLSLGDVWLRIVLGLLISGIVVVSLSFVITNIERPWTALDALILGAASASILIGLTHMLNAVRVQ